MVSERLKIVRCVTRLSAGRSVGLAATPSSAVECDDAIAGFRKCLDLRCPALAGSGDRVHQHDGLAGSAGVGEPESNPWNWRKLATRVSAAWRVLVGGGPDN